MSQHRIIARTTCTPTPESLHRIAALEHGTRMTLCFVAGPPEGVSEPWVPDRSFAGSERSWRTERRAARPRTAMFERRPRRRGAWVAPQGCSTMHGDDGGCRRWDALMQSVARRAFFRFFQADERAGTHHRRAIAGCTSPAVGCALRSSSR